MKFIQGYLFIILLFLTSCKNDKTNNVNVSPTIKPDSTKTADVDPEQKNRDVWQSPEYVIQLLGDISNETVADIGAGSGYFSFKILPKAKKLIAVDIDEKFIQLMNQKLQDYPVDQRQKFEARLAVPEDPKLKENEVQSALVVNTYIYIQERVKYFRNLKRCLSNHGRLVIIDFKNIDLPVGPPKSIKLSGEQIVEELKEAGYSNIKLDNDKLKYQYTIVAENIK